MAHKGGQQEHVQKSIGDYLTIQQIGSGSFAVVWKARHKVHGYEVAIKEINTERLNKKLQENLLSEIAILKKADHPNIIRLHEIVEAPNRIYLVLEYCAGGDLAAYITRCGKVSEGAARHFMQQLGNGLQVLRTNNLIHRDLKPQNLLLSTDDSNAVLKIADFGFARSLQPQGMAETLCGSPLYMAPEILQFQRYDAKADLWSVGAILYQLVTGRPPFFGNSHVQLLQNITKNDVQFSEALKAELHPDCIDICCRLLRRNPVERLSFEEFFSHSFMRLKLDKSSWHQPQNTTTTGGMSTDLQQEDCLPFLLDDDPQTVEGVPIKRQLEQCPPIEMRIHSRSPPSGKPEYGSKDLSVRLSLKHDSQSPKPFRNRSSDFLADAERIHDHADSSRGVTPADSLDCIEREYVLVSAYTDEPPTSLGASGAALSAGKLSGSPQKSKQPFLPVTPTNLASRGSTPPGNSQVSSDEMLEGPSQHPPTRISSLKRCARLIAELAADKLGASQIPEALSVQLVCLAIWKEALQICHTWGASTVEKRDTLSQASGSRGGDDASLEQESEASATIVCAQLERDFSMAVEHAEKFAAHLGNVDGGMEMPDAIELIFQAALAVGRAGAVEELMGNVTNAAVAYAKSSALLYFLLVEASFLPLNPPFTLSNLDRHRLCRYAEMLTARLNQCTNARQLLLQQQEQAGS